MKTHFLIIVFSCFFWSLNAQEIKMDSLKEVVVTSNNIDLPFSKNSRTITIINAVEINKSTATNLTDLLQEVTGLDIRKRGTDGMQSDIYIRGGHFNQTLILIDGIKVEDAQTGHHTMNVMLPIESIERIEIIKGAAARIFGQNAFNGAINLVTKKTTKKAISLSLNYGSFQNKKIGVNTSNNYKKASIQANYIYHESNGYQDNTDFTNHNIFLKSNLKTKNNPITILGAFSDKKFGANNFYTNNPAFNEYEETQTSLLGISTKYKLDKLQLKPKIYWKRNQDMFLLKRENPDFSRNFNISNKIGATLNSSYNSKIGITGFGIDLAKTTLSSNNLGDQNRTQINAFAEHRFSLANNKLDITPGVSVNYFSDFDFQTFPGFDIGYKANNRLKYYWNFGYSYRVPTYTEMYINIPNFLSGNKDLKPEKATSQEIGFKYNTNHFNIEGALFNRVATNLIDYIKKENTSPFYKAQNLRKIVTKGFEVNTNYKFNILTYKQKLKFGYTFLEDDYTETNIFKSRYLIDTSIKHHFTANLQTQFIKKIQQSITYKYVERPLNSYTVIDAKVMLKISNFNLFILANNILDTDYSEKINVPMPKSNYVVGLKYVF